MQRHDRDNCPAMLVLGAATATTTLYYKRYSFFLPEFPQIALNSKGFTSCTRLQQYIAQAGLLFRE